jgi:hypothetical protein
MTSSANEKTILLLEIYPGANVREWKLPKEEQLCLLEKHQMYPNEENPRPKTSNLIILQSHLVGQENEPD